MPDFAVRILDLLSTAGLEAVTSSSSWVYGNASTTLFLTVSISIRLKGMPERMHMLSQSKSGMIICMVLVSFPNLVDMVAAFSHKQTLPLSLNWNLNREISKINYRIHTDAIKGNLILPELTQRQKSFIYANEADLLNVALFGETASEWREKNPDKDGNIRDYANLQQLLVLANIESYNAILIEQNLGQEQRLILLRNMVEQQMKTLVGLGLGTERLLLK